MEQYYFDTSIWIDLYDKRGQNGEYAAALVEKIIANDWAILFSDMVLVELKQIGFSEHEILGMFNRAKPDHLRHVHITKAQTEKARALARKRNVPWRDALHAVLARDNDAQLVSRDRDFEKLREVTMAKRPEELIDVHA